MKRRQWKPEEKLKIVMEGLRADCTVSELCNRHQITQTQYTNEETSFCLTVQRYLLMVV